MIARSKRTLQNLVVACLAVTFFSASATAAFADVFSGTIVSYSASSGRLVVKSTTKKTTRQFRVAKSVRVSLDGKTSSLFRVKPGQSVSVFASGSNATRLIVRSPKSGSSTTTKPKTTRPTTPRTTTTPSRTTPSRTTPSSTTGSSTADKTSSASPWPGYRGPKRDNKSPDKGLLTSWSSEGPQPAWMATGLGQGYSSISMAHGKIYTMGSIGSDEMVIAVDASNGNRAWATRNGSTRQDGTGNGPRGTPTVDGDRVYALGANGDLSCLDAHTGRSIWRKNILQEFGGRNIQWGISESVLIDGEKLICTPGGSRATMVALNKTTGRPIWTANVPGNPSASYSSPIVFEVGGVRQYATFVHTGVIGIRARDGQAMWGQRESANGTANCSSPVFFNNTVFSASGYGTGGALFELQSRGGTTSSRSVWQTNKMKNHHGGMVEVDGFLYGCDEQILTCINLRTRDIAWQSRSVGKGSLTFADGHLYVRSESGPVALVEANPQRYVEKGRFEQPQKSGRNTWAHPVVADGKLFLRDQDKLFVYNVKGR